MERNEDKNGVKERERERINKEQVTRYLKEGMTKGREVKRRRKELKFEGTKCKIMYLVRDWGKKAKK